MWLGARQRDRGRRASRPVTRSSRCPQTAQSVAGNLAVVEGDDPIGELLPTFVPLAGNQYGVAFLGAFDRALDRRSAVEFDVELQPVDDLSCDRGRIFATRVVRSDDHL